MELLRGQIEQTKQRLLELQLQSQLKTQPQTQLQSHSQLQSQLQLQSHSQLQALLQSPLHPRLHAPPSAALLITASAFQATPTLEVSALSLYPPEADLQALEASRLELRQCGWYYGAVSWQESNDLLEGRADGTFLLRDSQHPGTRYSLSFKRPKFGPTSVRIQFSGGRFFLDSDASLRSRMPTFGSVVELVEFYCNQMAEGTHLLQEQGKQSIAATPVNLKQPLYSAPPSLAHMARLAINGSLRRSGRGREVSRLELPGKLVDYLRSYTAAV